MEEQVKQLHAQGKTVEQISEQLQIHPKAVVHILK